MTTARRYTCTKCGKKYVYYPSYSGRRPKDWGKSTRDLCPECCADNAPERSPK